MYYFKNFDKLISAKTINNPNNNFLVKFRNSLFTPANYYLGKPITDSDPFKLALVSYHLLRIQERDQSILNQVNDKLSASKNDKTLQQFREKIASELQNNTYALEGHISELKRVLNLNVMEIPIEAAVKSLYSLAHFGETQNEFYHKSIIPVVKAKIGYSGYQNLQDLVVALARTKYYEDQDLWNSILTRLEDKLSRPKEQVVYYSGWTLDTYETDKVKEKPVQTDNEVYYNDILKRGGFISQVKYQTRNLLNIPLARLTNRFLFNEGRLDTISARYEDTVEEERFIRALEESRQAIPNERIDRIVQTLKSS